MYAKCLVSFWAIGYLMGTLIHMFQSFDPALTINVPKSRYFPVEATSDLLLFQVPLEPTVRYSILWDFYLCNFLQHTSCACAVGPIHFCWWNSNSECCQIKTWWSCYWVRTWICKGMFLKTRQQPFLFWCIRVC